MNELDRKLVVACQAGLPLSARPYHALAEQVGAPVEEEGGVVREDSSLGGGVSSLGGGVSSFGGGVSSLSGKKRPGSAGSAAARQRARERRMARRGDAGDDDAFAVFAFGAASPGASPAVTPVKATAKLSSVVDMAVGRYT